MNPPALLSGIPAKAWEYLAVLLAIAVFGAFCYYKGGVAPRAERDAVQARFDAFAGQINAIGETAAKAAAEREKADKLAKEKADHDYQVRLDAAAAGWTAERDRLRKQLASANSHSRTMSKVAIAAKLSCDAASNDAISAAVSGYVEAAGRAFDECRSAANEFRNDVAQQLEQAEMNTAALACGITWAQSLP